MQNKQCPEFPYFGARYSDARCIDGRLHDLDNCDEQGNLYSNDDDHACPFCRPKDAIDNIMVDYLHFDERKESEAEFEYRYRMSQIEGLNKLRREHGYEDYVPVMLELSDVEASEGEG